MDFAEMFNRKLSEFLEDLEHVGIQSVPEYPLLKTSCQLLSSVDKKRPAEVFLKYVVGPYEKHVIDRNEEFFWNETYGGANDMSIANAIKQIWSTLDSVNKEAIWKHMQVLTVLAKKTMAQ